jgi:hypothetical protein
MVVIMKNLYKGILLFLFFAVNTPSQINKEFNFYGEVKLEITNPIAADRKDAVVAVSIEQIKKMKNNFNKDAFIVFDGENEIASQLYSNKDEILIVFVTDFKPEESKKVNIKYLENGRLKKEYRNRTYAELAMKFDAVYKDKKFTSDHFENFTKVVVPKIHTDHDALFKYEGPGWESELVGYRFYLDWRNATDIFGKTVNELVLHNVGVNDVIAKDDSYHEMQLWGMDIFKVGKSLGIGSIGMMNDGKIEMVSNTEQVTCEITNNGPICSEVETVYNGWQVGDKKLNLISKLSINAGSRITNVNLDLSGDSSDIVTGLAKHENGEFIKSNSNSSWQYIALYGPQTLANDNVGIVLFYDGNDLIEQGEDELSYYVNLKSVEGKVKYSFAAAWEQEPGGIKNKNDFINYVDEELMKLNNPLSIEIK